MALQRCRRCRPRNAVALAWLTWQVIRVQGLAHRLTPPKVRNRTPIPTIVFHSQRARTVCSQLRLWETRNPQIKETVETLDAHKASNDVGTARSLALAALMKRYGKADDSSGSSLSVMDILESLPNTSHLTVRDRAFCRLLITVTERRMGQIDKVIAFCSQQKASSPTSTKSKQARIDPLLRNVLRLGIAQILFARVPAHAAVQETVQLLRQRRPARDTSSPKPPIAEAKVKYVNAVLRRVARSNSTILNDAGADTAGLNVSPWLLREWLSAWGSSATDQILASAMQESPRCLTLRLSEKRTLPYSSSNRSVSGSWSEFNRAEKERLNETWMRLATLIADPSIESANRPPALQLLPQGSVRLLSPPPGPIRSWPLYEEGAWWLQDVSATLPALAIRSAMIASEAFRRNEAITVVDLCAAPGGKTAQLCDFEMFDTVIAVEKSKSRIRRLEENRERLGLDFEVVAADGTTWNPTKKAQAVLLDAPCTATGTGSKRPDVLRRAENYQDLVQTQFQLACNALENILDKGGILVYATCSLLRQESEDQVLRLLELYRNDVEMVPFVEGELPGFDSCIDPMHGWLRVVPGDPQLVESGVDPCDGFFVARLRTTR